MKRKKSKRLWVDKQRNWWQFTQSVVKYSTWSRVFRSVSIRMRSACAHFPIYVCIQEGGFLVEIWNFLNEKHQSAGLSEARYYLFSISSPESYWHWTCIKSASLIQQPTTVNQSQGYQNIFRCYLSLRKDLIGRLMKKIWGCPATETRRCQMSPKTYLRSCLNAIKFIFGKKNRKSQTCALISWVSCDLLVIFKAVTIQSLRGHFVLPHSTMKWETSCISIFCPN